MTEQEKTIEQDAHMYHCAFCGISSHEADIMIAHPTNETAICSKCITICVNHLIQRAERSAGKERP